MCDAPLKASDYEQKLEQARAWLREHPPRDPPVIGIHAVHWPRNECAVRTLRDADQLMGIEK